MTMQVIGFNFDKISAERKSQEAKSNLKVNSTLNIKHVVEEKILVMKDQAGLRFSFEFLTEYAPDYASLIFTGSILMTAEKGEGKDILKRWKDKEINPNLQISLFNLILSKCNVRSLQLEDELGLPLHIQLPRISDEKSLSSPSSSNYAG